MMVFAMHQRASATGIHVSPDPEPTSFPTLSLWVVFSSDDINWYSILPPQRDTSLRWLPKLVVTVLWLNLVVHEFYGAYKLGFWGTLWFSSWTLQGNLSRPSRISLGQIPALYSLLSENISVLRFFLCMIFFFFNICELLICLSRMLWFPE